MKGRASHPESKNSSISSIPLRKLRENWEERKTSPWPPPTQQEHTCRQFCCQQSCTVYDNSWRSSAWISATDIHLCFSLLLFFKTLPLLLPLDLQLCTSFASLATGTLKPDTLHWCVLHAGTSPGSRHFTTSFLH